MGHCINTWRWLVSLTDVFLFSKSALVTTRLTWSCQDAKGKRSWKTYVSLGNLYFIREGKRFSIRKSLEVLKRLLVKQREKYDKRVEANPRKWLLQLSNRSRYKVLLLKVLVHPPYILLVYCRVIQSTHMLQNILVMRWIRKKEYMSQSWEIKERKGKDTSVQKGMESKRRKSTVRWVKYSNKRSQRESWWVKEEKDYKGVDVAAGVIKIEKRKHLWQCQDMRERVSTKRSKENEVAVQLLDAEGKQNAKRKGDHNTDLKNGI